MWIKLDANIPIDWANHQAIPAHAVLWLLPVFQRFDVFLCLSLESLTPRVLEPYEIRRIQVGLSAFFKYNYD